MNKPDKCEFDKPDGCHALACYSRRECKARDKNGNPRYVSRIKTRRDK